MNSKINPNEKLKFRESLAYAVGGGGINLMTTSILGAILVYYTYVVGISAGVAASVLGISRIFDGISDIIAGRIVDKTNSKYGKAKPWFIRMLIPMLLSTVACFMVPASWGTVAQAVYMFVTYNLACTVCGTLLSVANGALNGFMTLHQGSRGVNGAVIMLANTVSNMVFNMLYLHMAKFFGGGDQYSQKGWAITIIIFSLMYIPLMLIAFFGTKERVTLAEMETEKKLDDSQEEKKNEVNIVETFKTLLKNKYWIITVIVGFLIYFSLSINSAVLVYFSDYVLGDINLQALLSLCTAVGSIPGVIVAVPIMSKFGKQIPIIFGMAVGVIATVPMILTVDPTVCMISTLIKGISFGVTAAPIGSFVHDALTYGIWKYKINCIGIGSSATSMASKLGSGVSSFAVGILLELGGFVSGGGAQPESAVTMISVMFIWIPFILSILIILIMIPYDLDKKYARITEDLANGRYAEE